MTVDELPDEYVFSDEEKDAIEDAVWTGYFQNHVDPGPQVWKLHALLTNEHRVKPKGHKPTLGEIREVIRRDKAERDFGFYKSAGGDSLYDSDAYNGRGGLFSAPAIRADDPSRYELLVRRREYFAATGELPNF